MLLILYVSRTSISHFDKCHPELVVVLSVTLRINSGGNLIVLVPLLSFMF